MATGLRERRRQQAMRTIQEKALDLFDEHGFDAVTIEQVAAASEVSPSSVYRYFGTKEGIVVADEFDDMSEAGLDDLLDADDPIGSLLAVVHAYEATPRDEPDAHRRVRYIFAEPSVRRAACATFDDASQRLAPVFVAGGLPPAQARVAASALVFGYFACLEEWYADGCSKPIASYVEGGMQVLRAVWPGKG